MDQAAVRAALNAIFDPCSVASGRAIGLCDMGLIEDVDIAATGVVTVRLRLTSPSCMMIGFLVTAVREAVQSLTGVSTVIVLHDAGENWDPDMISDGIRAERDALWKARMAELGGARHRGLPQRAEVS
ncbi:metal-sulfur cluster assembly factor [Novosphingobium colocasiae]|uniref:MIP18 family-like domain-containing protein n=1 Tax=Novosphingobium colocasiae TaxID=1256513 RepID=A0A918P9V2_9SPHN|nr:iron-sulfur cluster assembly protein [Novosphingobium colocasiae]GGY93219.1 hypothetical protein GCM10011614_05210 [Novosphingobium colocasiae]